MSKFLFKVLFALVLSGSFTVQTALAFPTLKLGQTPGAFAMHPALSLPQQILWGKVTDNLLYDFEGIVGLSGCSGSLVRFENSLKSDKGIVMTNGHCVELMAPNTFKYNMVSAKSFTLLSSKAVSLGTVKAQQLLYATMTGTDVALYQLRDSYEQIFKAFKIRPFTIQSTSPDQGQAIDILSGYWKKGFSCTIEKVVHQLKEGDWLFKQSLRYSRPGCFTYGGTSGSPVIAANSRTVVAINNTGNDAGEACTLNNPCEIDEAGTVFYKKDYSYAQQTSWIYSCLNETNQLDLQKPGCNLFHGAANINASANLTANIP